MAPAPSAIPASKIKNTSLHVHQIFCYDIMYLIQEMSAYSEYVGNLNGHARLRWIIPKSL